MSEKEVLQNLVLLVSCAERLREAGFTAGSESVMLYVAKVLRQLGKKIDEEHNLPF